MRLNSAYLYSMFRQEMRCSRKQQKTLAKRLHFISNLHQASSTLGHVGSKTRLPGQVLKTFIEVLIRFQHYFMMALYRSPE